MRDFRSYSSRGSISSIIHYQPAQQAFPFVYFSLLTARKLRTGAKNRGGGREEETPSRAHPKYGNRLFGAENSTETLASQAKFITRGSDNSVGRKPHFQAEFQQKWKEILKQCSCEFN